MRFSEAQVVLFLLNMGTTSPMIMARLGTQLDPVSHKWKWSQELVSFLSGDRTPDSDIIRSHLTTNTLEPQSTTLLNETQENCP